MNTLTHDALVKLLHYDPETGVFTRNVYRSHNARAGMPAGTTAHNGYRVIYIDGKLHQAHRLAWFYMTRSWPRAEIDHINGVRSDNKFSNLREANRAQNSRNVGIGKNNKSGFKGVCFDRGKWKAQIKVNNEKRDLGRFNTPEEAHAVYVDASKKYHGEFARSE